MENENQELIVFEDENGKECSFASLGLINYDGESYVITKPIGIPSYAEDEVVIFEVKEGEDGSTLYRGVTDEVLANRILEEFESLL